MHPLRKALLRFLLDEQPGQVYMHWQTYVPGAVTLGQCRDYVMTTDPRFLSKKRGTREALLASARRSAGMPRERLISRLYRWHMERQGKVAMYPLDVPVLVKHWSTSTKGETSAHVPFDDSVCDLPKFLQKQHERMQP